MWANLPRELLAMILLQLGLADLACVAAVCASWRSITQWFATEHGLSAHHLPWIVPCRRPDPNHQIRALLNPYGRWDGSRRRCCGVHGEWMVIAEEFNPVPYLLHSLLRHRIDLPRQLTLQLKSTHAKRWRRSPYFMHKVILSSPPTSGDCTAVAIFGKEELAYCRVGLGSSASAWTKLETGENHYNDVVFFNGQLYAVDSKEFLWAFELGPNNGPFTKRLVIKAESEWEWGWGDDGGLRKRYLVESNGRLVMVVREREEAQSWPLVNRFRRMRTVNLQVLELDLGEECWTQLGSLGERVMFLGRSISALVMAKGVLQELWVNCVYLTDDEMTESRWPEDMVMFTMVDRKVVRLRPRGWRLPLFFYMFNYCCLL